DSADEVDDHLVAGCRLLRLRRVTVALAVGGEPLELLVDLLVGHRHGQSLELEALDRRRLDLRQHLELDLELGVLALLVALVEVDLRLQRRAQLLLAHQRVDRFAQARVERVGVQCLAVHLADQVRGHLAGAEAGHAHLRRDLLHLGVDARLDLLRGNLERVGALEPFIGGFNDLHFRTFHTLSSEPAPRGNWCGRRDSNPHILRYWNLNPARLPVPPRPRPDESIAGTRLRSRDAPLEARAGKGKTCGCRLRSKEQARLRLVSIAYDKEPDHDADFRTRRPRAERAHTGIAARPLHPERRRRNSSWQATRRTRAG